MKTSTMRKMSWVVLINIFLVVIAGSIVRMTGSGMGCPDWPKCFGYWIPPTSEAQISWLENHEFKEAQMIIMDSALWVAETNFVSGNNFNGENWKKYTKHDYAQFNKFHTWTENINRWFGALLGIFTFVMVVLSLNYWKKNKQIVHLSFFQLFMVGFEAWLGKLTVDTNLNVSMITYHMLGVIVMIVIQLWLLRLLDESTDKNENLVSKSVKWVIGAGILLMIIQIVLGTQVRQQTDSMIDAGISRELLADGFDWVFYVHRSFSFLIVFVVAFLVMKLKAMPKLGKLSGYLVVLTLLEVLAGIVLFYFNMQSFAQPIHLLLSFLMFGVLVEIGLYSFHPILNKIKS